MFPGFEGLWACRTNVNQPVFSEKSDGNKIRKTGFSEK